MAVFLMGHRFTLVVFVIVLVFAFNWRIYFWIEHHRLSINYYFHFFRYVCEEHWPLPLYNYYYTIALLVLQFMIPLLVLIFTYTRIAFAVWGKKPPGEAENSRDQRMAKSKRKVRIEIHDGMTNPKTTITKPIKIHRKYIHAPNSGCSIMGRRIFDKHYPK